MRLLDTSILELSEFFGDRIPHYAILSHRWESEEVTFRDLQDGKGPKREGWGKVKECCAKAAADGWKYVWIDSCCIDKTSSAELSEAINSMYQWYRGAQICYAYLSDVEAVSETASGAGIDSGASSSGIFEHSQWFKRGWTLQELLAPRWVEFFDRDWTSIGTKSSLEQSIGKITGIDVAHLFSFEKASVAKKMSWAAGRETTRIEDEAYCLLGLFGVNMPPLYGEGENAFLRLQLEILSKVDDDSIFAWSDSLFALSGEGSGGMLAPSPQSFGGSRYISARRSLDHQIPFTMTNKGLRVEAALLPAHTPELLSVTGTSDLLVLNCVHDIDAFDRTFHVGLPLYKSLGGVWKRGLELQHYEKHVTKAHITASKHTLLYIPQLVESKAFPVPDIWVDFTALSGIEFDAVVRSYGRNAKVEEFDSMLILKHTPLKATSTAKFYFQSPYYAGFLVLLIGVSGHRTFIELFGLKDITGLTLGLAARKFPLKSADLGDNSSWILEDLESNAAWDSNPFFADETPSSEDKTLVTAKLSKTQKQGKPIELITLSAQRVTMTSCKTTARPIALNSGSSSLSSSSEENT